MRTQGGKRYRDGQRPTPTANHHGPELRPPTAPRPKAPTQEGGKSRRASMAVLLHAGCQGDSRWPSHLARNPSKTAPRHHGNDQALNSRARRQGVLDKRLDGRPIPKTLKPGREEQRPKAATHTPPPMRTWTTGLSQGWTMPYRSQACTTCAFMSKGISPRGKCHRLRLKRRRPHRRMSTAAT